MFFYKKDLEKYIISLCLNRNLKYIIYLNTDIFKIWSYYNIVDILS